MIYTMSITRNAVMSTDRLASLLAQQSELIKQIEHERSHARADALTQIRTIMHAYGITSGDLHGTKGAKARTLYRGPAGETWSGRGKHPRWLTAALAAGHTKDSLRV